MYFSTHVFLGGTEYTIKCKIDAYQTLFPGSERYNASNLTAWSGVAADKSISLITSCTFQSTTHMIKIREL